MTVGLGAAEIHEWWLLSSLGAQCLVLMAGRYDRWTIRNWLSIFLHGFTVRGNLSGQRIEKQSGTVISRCMDSVLWILPICSNLLEEEQQWHDTEWWSDWIDDEKITPVQAAAERGERSNEVPRTQQQSLRTVRQQWLTSPHLSFRSLTVKPIFSVNNSIYLQLHYWKKNNNILSKWFCFISSGDLLLIS